MEAMEKKGKKSRAKGFVLAGAAAAAVAAVAIALMLTVFDGTPGDVAGVDVGDSTTHAIEISWDAAKKATGYEITAVPVNGDGIYEAAGREAPSYPIEVSDETAITLEGLAADEGYVVTVRAFADKKDGKRVYQEGEGAEAEARTAAPVLPLLSAPVLAADSPDTVSGAVGAVVPEEGAVLYAFFFSSSEDGEYELIEAAEPAFAKGGLSEQTAYYVYAGLVLILDGKRFAGEYSEKASVTTPAAPVAVPPASGSGGNGSSGSSASSYSGGGVPFFSDGSPAPDDGQDWSQIAGVWNIGDDWDWTQVAL
jgi:hypothetical protein